MTIKIGSCNTLIDDQHAKLLTGAWHAGKYRNGYYIRNGQGELLHRLIAGAKEGEIVDHINGNTLDNRKENLRICTNQQNVRYQKIAKHNKTGFKGVRQHRDKFEANIKVNKKTIYLGLYANVKDAAEAYDQAAEKYFGNFALTNRSLGLI